MPEEYEEEYHCIIHKHLLQDERYYSFRAKHADKTYWKYLHGKVLEFGCGLGQNIYLKKERAIGLDISNFCKKECEKKGINIIQDSKKFKDNSFDSVLACHVLEHMENPSEILREFYRILKDNGKLVLILPVSCHNRPYKNWKTDKSKHLFQWNFAAINELLYFIGFKIKLNMFNYAYGYSLFYKLPFSVGNYLLQTAGFLRNRKEMLIVAEK
ncbi:class I SAM-dependent methyltransferase [Candidatus Woesearchaeota archaeon]|nr:class I SAM-dependent methyltransferase [Candidatus Woesearchaeota archaeon]